MKTALIKDVILAVVCSVALTVGVCLFLQWFKSGGAQVLGL